MNVRVVSGGLIEVSKSVHIPVLTDEKYGWVEGKFYLTPEEVSSLYVMVPHLLEESKAVKTKEVEAKLKKLEEEIASLKGGLL